MKIYITNEEKILNKSLSLLIQSINSFNKNSGGYARFQIIADSVCVTRTLSNGSCNMQKFTNDKVGFSRAIHFIESSSAKEGNLQEVAA
ncbi:hypothetical protein [Paraglaciecola sp.]|uniref:hypothetical protein n=1 Tax=Paraglaciecola sp. TaxID=1920173 RepID=UPI003EF3BF68